MSGIQQVFPIGLTLAGKPVAVVGGETEAADKVGRLLDAGALVTVYAPVLENERLQAWQRQGSIQVEARWLDPTEVDAQALILSTRFDSAYNEALAAACRAKRILVSCYDQADRSDFSMPAVAKGGLLRIAVFTAGASPVLARRIRQALENAFDEKFIQWLEKLGAYREQVKAEEPDFAKRREALNQAVEGFEMKVAIEIPPEAGISEKATARR